jgi:hypothetical protein
MRTERLYDIMTELTAIRRHMPPAVGHHLQRAEDAIEDALANLRSQHGSRSGQFARVLPAFKRNPELVIFNPPGRRSRRTQYQGKVVGIVGKRVHDIRYVHADDGQAYEHPFETPVMLYAMQEHDGSHDILLKSPGGLELWRDF